MTSLKQRIRQLAEDLRQRKVFRAAALYWLGSLGVLGGLDLVRDLLPWLDRVFPALVLTGILGFPVVVLTAWAFDWTEEGLTFYRPAAPFAPGWVHRLTVLGLLLGASGAFGWGVWQLWSPATAGRASAGVNALDPARLAVLYFDDHSPGGQLGHLANGLTEELIGTLGNVDGLSVTSRNGVRPFRQAAVSSDSIARRLDVGTLVSGSVTGEGGRVRVNAELVDVSRGDQQLWSGQFEHDEEDILTLQSELVEEISASLRQNLGVVVRSRQAASETSDDQAWLRHQEAREMLEEALRADVTESYALDMVDRADALLAEASRRDPDWSAPMVQRGWLAVERSRLASPVAGFVQPADSTALLTRADSAVTHSGGSAAALELRGVVRFELAEAVPEGQHWRVGAEDDLEAAIREDPRRARALAYLAEMRRAAGDFEDARRYAQRALESDAFLEDAEDVIYSLYTVNVELKGWQDADRWCREGRRRFGSLRFLFCRLQFESLRPDVGPPTVAWALLDTIRRESSDEDWDFQYRTWAGYQVARVLARHGLADSTTAVLEDYVPGPVDRPWFAYDEAHVHLELGREEEALEALRLYLGVAPDRRDYLPSDWLFEELWDDPRFQDLTASDPEP